MICGLYSVSDELARRVAADPAQIRDLLTALDGAEAGCWIEKSWHGIHFTLTGSAWDGEPPENFLVSGGEPIGREDVGYGPARLLDPERVAILDAALAPWTRAEFARRFDLAKLAEEDIYPSIWDEPPEELLAEYFDYFEQIQRFIGKAHRNRDAVIIVIA